MKKLIVGCLLAAMAAGVAVVNADTHRWGEDAYSKKETNIDYPTNRNFQRGWQLYGEGKFDEAEEALKKAVDDDNSNGWAYAMLSDIHYRKDEYGIAMSCANRALDKLPVADKEFRAFSFNMRGKVYLEMQDTVAALRDYTAAIGLKSDYAPYYGDRAEVYYRQEQYAMADRDYRKMVSTDAGNVVGYMGLGRNLEAQKRYDEAIEQYDKAITMYPEYSSGYSFRASCYCSKKMYSQAIDDCISALLCDAGDNKAYACIITTLSDSAYVMTVAKLKAQQSRTPDQAVWAFLEGVVHKRHIKNIKAIKAFKKAKIANGTNPSIYINLAECYENIGDYETALAMVNNALMLNPDDFYYGVVKVQIEDDGGYTKQALADADALVNKYPDQAYAYYKRGWILDQNGKTDDAIDDMTMSVTLDPSYIHSYISRGAMLYKKGRIEEANADFRKILEVDTVPEQMEGAFYAYFYLGQRDKAIKAMDEALRADDKGKYYDAACLYSLMGDTDKSLSYLEKALQDGFRRFAHIARDEDLKNLRKNPRYKSLIDKYKKIMAEEISEARKN